MALLALESCTIISVLCTFLEFMELVLGKTIRDWENRFVLSCQKRKGEDVLPVDCHETYIIDLGLVCRAQARTQAGLHLRGN